MSIDEFDRLWRAVISVIGEADFSGRADPAATVAQIDAAERALGLHLPSAYIGRVIDAE